MNDASAGVLSSTTTGIATPVPVASPPGSTSTEAVGVPRPRVEGGAKVSGTARYAADEPIDGLAYGSMVLATVSRGRVSEMDVSVALSMPGVLGVIDHSNAPRLNPEAGNFFGPDAGLLLLQNDVVPFAGWPIALVLARTPEMAQAAADSVQATYQAEPHDTTFSAAHPGARPALTIFGEDANVGDVDARLAAADVVVDERYRTPEEHCGAMELHSATAWWEGNRLQAFDSNQGPSTVAAVLATLFSLPLDRIRIRSEHVGGGFGSKGLCGPQLVLAVMGSMRFGRPVRVTLTRNQVFLLTPPRPATDQRVRIGATADGRLTAIDHQAVFSLSRLGEYVENCTEMTKTMYSAPAVRTELSAIPLDVLPPNSVRGPGMTPGSFALESAMDEAAERLAIDPVEFRLRNEPSVGPVSGLPYSSPNLPACLHEGARRFNWAARDPRPRRRREGHLLIGTGVAAANFSTGALPSSAAITAEADGTFSVLIGASDIGTGARTALIALAADALAVPTELIRIRIADTDFGPAWAAGGSRGTTSWAWAISEAAAKLRGEFADAPRPVTATADTTDLVFKLPPMERHAYSSIFSEVTVDPATGEVRMRRLLGIFAIGRVVNPLTARSQAVGGMIMGLSIALHEESMRDAVSGRHVNADFAGYHIAVHADVPEVEADFVPDYEPGDPWGIKGVGEIGTVATAASIANAVWHATGVRQRTLPIRLDRVLEENPGTRPSEHA
jgi:xanthine dehydrogenase YagR molybdenum-binding subunit